MKNKPLLKLEGVQNSFTKNGQETLGIRNINLEIFPKEIVSIIGPSGCGKTTLLKVLSNIIKPDGGQVHYGNHDISVARKSGKLALVPQFFALMPNLTVWENIELPQKIQEIENPKKIRKLIKMLKLKGTEKLYPGQLSGGMQQRVAIARAMVYEPKILLMDEPFASLDEILREELNCELVSLAKKLNQTVVFVTHNIEEAVFISDRIILMKSSPGEIVEEIPVKLGIRSSKLRNSQRFFNRVKAVRTMIKKKGIW